MNIKSPFGLRDGQLVHISETENGFACNCICPACEKPFIAKKGSSKEHHFAHIDHSLCQYSIEATLLFIAKAILEKHKRIMLPALFFSNSDKMIYPATSVLLHTITLEKYNNMTSHIGAYVRDTPILIQVSQSNTGIYGIATLGHSAIRINIGTSFNPDQPINIDSNDLVTQLMEIPYNRFWIYNRKHYDIAKQITALKSYRNAVETNMEAYPLIIENCPINKKLWKSGYKKGQSYASIFDDCNYCPYGDIVRAKKYFNNEEMAIGKILGVQCCGDRLSEIDAVITQYQQAYKKNRGY